MKKNFMLVCIALILAMTLIVSCDNSNKNPDAGKFTVTFDTDGGGAIDPVKVGLWQTVAEPEDPTRDGFTFVEWQLDGQKYDFKTPVKKNIILKAVWKWDGVEVDNEAKLIEAVKLNDSKILITNDILLTDTVTIEKNVLINLNNHSITGNRKRAILVNTGTTTLTGKGIITVSEGIKANSSVIRVSNKGETEAKLIIGSDVTISSDYSYGITVFGKNKGILLLNGTVKTKDVPAISGNGSSGMESTEITINGTVITENENAIYHPQDGILTINGTVKGQGGIEAKSGTTVSLTDKARVEATATEKDNTPNSNGCSTSGYAIVAVENKDYKGNPKFEISGGTFIGPIGIIKDNEVSAEKKASIVITGGTFSTEPATEYIALGFTVKGKSSPYTVVAVE